MQNEQQSSETLNVSGGEVEKNRFDGNNAPIFKDISGSVTINHNYPADTKGFPHCDLGATKDRSVSAISSQGNRFESDEIVQIKDKLNELLVQKRELEIQLESVRSQINIILKGEIDSNLVNLLNWLSDRHQLAKKYGKMTLRGFQNLRQEAETKGNLDDFFSQVESYLELIEFSLRYNNTIFLQEPPIAPTFADPDIYISASADIYKEIFRVFKKHIPKSDVDVSTRIKLEDYFDELLERIQTYF